MSAVITKSSPKSNAKSRSKSQKSSSKAAGKSKSSTGVVRLRLPKEKGNELFGLTLLTVSVLLGLALVSFHVNDPSVFHQPPFDDAPVRNWVGPVGAQVAAVLFNLFGITCLLAPALLMLAGWRRVRTQLHEHALGRGVGVLILLATLPAVLQQLLGAITWRGGELEAGGGFGTLIYQGLASQLSFVGTLVLLLAGVVIGATLMVQSTLADILGVLRERLAGGWESVRLAWERRKERRDKEARGRERAKQMERVAEKQRKRLEEAVEEAVPAVEAPPPRVTERKGSGGFAVRRVKGEPTRDDEAPPVKAPAASASGGKSPAKSSASGVPQKSFEFPAGDGDGALPPVNLLRMEDGSSKVDEDALIRLGEAIRSRCQEFGVEGNVVGIHPGPVVTVYEFQPAPGVKVSQIVNLQDDLALALKAEAVRIDRIPGRSTLGIEVPNKDRSIIRLGGLIARQEFDKAGSVLTMALGTDIGGEPYYADLATMPHLLVAGATGAGKSVGLQSMITSILYKSRREDVQFIFIDPKRVELGVYADIPHLKTEVVVDPKKAANALRWAVGEMERRYRLLAEVHVRSIAYYNQVIRDPQVQERLALSDDDEMDVQTEDLQPMPYYVIIIDELADLMMVASSEVETCIARLAQMARAVGIHLIIATQRPSVDVLTGTIKANFPCRLAFATTTRHDSRTILDQVGSEKLLGKGDMLFMAPGTSRTVRLHGAYITEAETAGLVRWLKKQGKPQLDPEVLKDTSSSSSSGAGGGDDDGDELYDEAARLVVSEGQASASFLQRRMRVGFSRAARLIDMMERDGLLGPPQGSKPRDVLVKPDFFEEIDAAQEV
ncbi:MAG: DNA translocase FtsK 4TM domain-containing protein [Acidobacteriota bacterium]|nr:DNA translocase FtsK 4TM domain-containing protein [Acidobacteriota bacterium]